MRISLPLGLPLLRYIARWQAAGYRVELIFLQLASADEAMRGRELAAKTATALVDMRHGSLEHLYPQTASTAARAQEAAVEYVKSA